MGRHWVVLLVSVLIGAMPSLSRADATHPTSAEVNALVDVLKFRGGMMREPRKTIDAFAVGDASGAFARMATQMEKAGSGEPGWRLLLGTSVFTVVALDQPRTLVAFYNPWVDSALITIWEQRHEGRRIVDAEWVAGDLIRQPQAEIDPRPLWLRGDGYRPETLAQAVIATVKAVDARMPAGQIVGWRDVFGVKETRSTDRFVAPILVTRLYEAQLRLAALAVQRPGEDARLVPLRRAIKDLISGVATQGFAKPLASARDTSKPMRDALIKLNAKTLQGLGPIAYVVGEGYATVFLGSTATADYVIAARFAERVSGYTLQQLDFIPYAATYQAALQGAAGGVPK